MEGYSQKEVYPDPPPPYSAKQEFSNAHHQQHSEPDFIYPGNENPTIRTVTVIQPIQLDSKSQMIYCPHCGVQTMTKTKTKPNASTHTIALLLFCFVCWPCAWVPYACDSCQSIHHYCSNCKAYIGEHRSQ